MINSLFHHNICTLIAPATGELIAVEDVPDEVFSGKMMGDGIAIQVQEGLIVSPVKGKVIQIFPSNHALCILSTEGLEILIHLGIDTVELKGKGFTRLIEPEAQVEVGTPLIQMDLDSLRDSGKCLISPIIILNKEKVKSLQPTKGFVRAAEDPVLKVQYKK